ncbi:hypothetical protein V6N13_079288 [Hibiscus sabdariffa]
MIECLMELRRSGDRSLLEANGWPNLRLPRLFRCGSSNSRHSNGRPFTILHSIHLLRDLEWSLVFSKVDRCLNGVADSLAKSNLNDAFDVVFYEEPPIGLALD